ncbi:alpha-1,4-N-acetylglucosaminyltransferase-like [Rana temporaria]|uniref:alpha-1,4-N-acetylglucosaminyltransferase-like n=1 Tax=Rana temporaria TaxID=8407 RepID=UPI001AAE10C2|nr:alpha-1,4-N-acetylglucosaminyltransferase-like [Rana temporaria]
MIMRYLRILIFVLFLTAVSYIYRFTLKKSTMRYLYLTGNEIKVLSGKLISSQENGNGLLKTTTEGMKTQASSSHLNPVNVLRDNGIIFVEVTDRMKPLSLALCAIESAARVYKDRPVAYFMKGLNGTNSETVKMKYFPTLMPHNNVYFFPLKMEEVLAETPLLSWYQKIDPSREKFWIHVSSDAMRLALIWKYGGIWMDSDIISRQQIPHQNFLAAESNQRSSNGVFGFPSHHDFIWRSMEDFTSKYNSEIWGYQGPWLFTRILNTFCSIPPFKSVEDVMCGNITFLNPQRFYPVFYTDWQRYFEVWTKEPTFNDSYALHLWNHFNNGPVLNPALGLFLLILTGAFCAFLNPVSELYIHYLCICLLSDFHIL